MKQDSTDPTKLQAKDILTRNRHLLPSEIVDSDQQGDPPAPTDKYDVNSLIDKIYGGGLSAEKPTDKAPSKPIQGKQPEYSEDQQRYAELSTKRQELTRERSQLKSEGTGVNYQQISDISGRLKSIEGEIKDLKPSGAGVRFLNGINNFVQGASEVPVGLLMGIATTAKWLDETLGVDFQPGDVDEQFTYQLGQRLRALVNENFKTDPILQEEFSQQLAAGLGSFLGFAGGGAITKMLTGSMKAAQAFAWVTAGFGGAGRSYEEAKEFGASEDDAQMAAKWGFLPGIVQVSNTALRVLNRWDRAYGGRLVEGLARRVLESGKSGINEALVETLGQVGFNAIAKELYDAERPYMEGWAESASVGGGAGFLSDIILTGLGGRAAKMAGRTNAGEPQNQERPGPIVEREPVTVGKYKDQDVKVVGEDEAGDLYIEFPDGKQKLVDADAISDLVEITPQEQEAAERSMMEIDESESNDAEAQENVVVDPDTGDFLYPGEVGYEEAVAKIDRVSNRITELTIGQGRNRQIVDLQEGADGSFNVLNTKIADGEGGIIETPISELTGKEVNDIVNDLTEELSGRGSEYTIEAMPTDPTDPFSKMQILVMPSDSQLGKSINNKRKLGQYSIEADGAEIKVINPDGKEIGNRSKYFLPKLKEFFEQSADEYSKMPRLTDDPDSGVNEGNFVGEVSQRSENPVEIAEAYQQAIQTLDEQSDGNYKEMIIANDLASSRLPSSDLDGRGLDGAIYYAQYASKRADVDLGMRADYLSDQAGMDISVDDIMDFIRANPGGPKNVINRKPEIIQRLEDQFQKVTGIDINIGVANALTGSQGIERRQTSKEEFLKDLDSDLNSDEDLSALGIKDDSIESVKRELENEGVSKDEIEQIEQAASQTEQSIEDLETAVTTSKTEEETLAELENFFDGLTIKDKSAKPVQAKTETKQEDTDGTITEVAQEDPGISEATEKPKTGAEVENATKDENEGYFPSKSFDKGDVIESQDGVRYEVLNPNKKGRAELKNLSDSTRPGEITDYNADILFFKLSDNQDKNLPKPEKRKVELKNPTEFNAFSDYLDYKRAVYETEGKRKTEIKHLLENQDSHNWRTTHKKQDENKEKETPTKSKNPYDRSKSPLEFAKSFLYARVERGDTLDSMKSYSGRGGSGGSIQIGGYVDGKKYPNTKVIVSEHKGKKVNEVFSVKDIYDSIKDDLEGGGLFNQGETVSDAKETKAEILKSKEEKAKEELNSLFDEFNDQISGQLNTGFDPKLIELSIKIIGKGSEIGYIKFQQFADFVIAQKGEPFFRKIFKNFKAAYMGAMALEGNKHKEDLNVLALSNADDFIKPKDTAEGTINNPVKAEKASDIKKAAKQTDTEPTDPQKEAGNYKMGHINVQGLNITIENPKGSIRRGKASDGTEWEVKMPAHYGYIKRSEGADGDHFDVTIGDSPQSDTVFVIDQIDLDAKFDEHKGFIGFNTRKDAVQAYNDSFSDDSGPSRMGAITEMSMDEFKRYLKGDTSSALLYGKKGKGTADISTHPIMKMRNNFLRDLYESDLPGKGVSYAQVPSKGGFDVTVYVRREGNMPGNAKLTDPEYSVPIELSLGVNTITAKIDHPKPDLDQVTTMIDAMSDVASKSGIEFSTDIVQESSQENIGDTQDNIVPKEGWRDNLIKARQYANELKVPGRADVWTDKEALVSKIQSFVEGDSAEAPVGDIQGLREALSDRGRKFESNIISGVVDMMAPKEGARAFASVSGRYMNENNAPGKGNPVINFDWVNDWAYDPATNTIYAHIIPTRAMDDPQGGTKNFKSDIQDSQEIISKITKLGQQSETDQADLFGQSAQTAKPNKPANKKAESEKPNEITSDEVGFIAEIKSNIKKGRVLSKSQLNALADKHEVEGGDKRIKELAEYAIVSQARQIVESNPLADDAYSEMVDLYTSQPNLTARTSSSIELQQYSTPAPLAYMMGRYVNLHNGVAGFEPSAGNGLLTIAAGKSVKNIIANEIDSDRLDTLNQQGFNRVTNQDGSKEFTGLLNTQQAIVTNPPFGATDARFGYTIDGRNGEMTKLEHVMSARALQTMRDDGKAAIIIGGNDSFNDNGMRTGQDGVFFNWLYHNYNVEDIINLDGAFFRKQGTSFPTRIILVNGRKMLPEGFAPLHEIPPKVVDSFDSFYQIINTKLSEANHEAVSQPQLDSGRGTDSTVSDKGSRFGSDNIGGQTDSIPTQGSRNDNRSGRKPGADNQGNDAGATRGDIADGQSGLFGEPASQQQSLSDTSKSDQRAIGQQSEGESSPGQAEQQRTPRSTPREKSVLDSRITAKDVLDNDGGNLDYAPLSNSGVIQTEMPATMAMSMRNTLEGLADRVGNVDAFVMDKLGYDNVDQLYDALAAEQVDAVALAIAQIENGKSLIVGDQTGIGKGRVAASMIRYAKNQGMTPVFFTEKDNLFTDMHRDLVDVGSSFRPFIVNSSTNIEDQSGKVVFRTDKTTRHNKVLKNPSLASEYDYVAVTYSQIQSENYSKKRDFIKALAPNALIIMDESHNASGNSNTGEYMMEVIGEAKGAVYLSATFAKRPDNMPVYAIKTDISDVAMDTDEMIEAIERGGVALQEIISSDLVKSGQMVRRQRSFKGVKREFEVMGTNEDGTLNKDGQAQRKLYDEASEVMRDIIDFQNVYVSEILSGMEKSLKMEAKEALGQRGVKKAGVDNQPFVSRIHNIVDQLLFSIKVDAVADEAIRIIKSDRKPVIAVKSTMETILDDTFTTGEGVESLNFGIVMERALKSVMKYRVKDAISKTEDAKQLTREELSDHGKRAYDRIVERSKGITTDLHPSPLDYLVMKIEKAGFSVGEVTGRSRKINLNPDGTGVLQNRTKAEKDKTTLYRGFNEGDLDALIINSSGATGASAHSSEKFGDRRQRVMIIHQPELNINTEVQKWGRIFRTGQVVLPEYKYITSSIPAETRLMMVLKKKIKSLDANVTSSQKTSSEFLEMEDFINKYGDFIVTQYLRENQDLHQKMQNPIGKEDWQKVLDGSKVSVADIAMKATGRIALLDSKTQEDFYEVISERYASHIDMLNEYGENELIMDSFDLQAETVKKDLLVKGDNKNSVFGGDSYLETVQAKVLRKPMKREELDKIINDNLGGKIPEVYSNELAKEAEFYIDSWLSEKRLDISRRELTTEERIEVNSRAHDQAAEWKRNTVKRLFNKFKPRDVYVIPADSRAVSGITKNAIFVGFDINPKSRNPFAPSAIKLKFVTNDTQRSVTVPGSNVAFINSAIADTGHLSQYARNDIYQNWDSKLDSNNFETRLIATGNILQAMGKLDGKGQLIQFTTKDGSIKNGVLLPKNMKEAKLKKLNKVRVKAVEAEKQVFDLRAGHSLEMTSGVSFERDWHGTIRLNVQSSKVKGGKFFLDTDLRDLVGDFTKRGSKMKVDVPSESVSRVLKILTDKFSVYAEVPLENVQEGESVRMLLSESATEESLAAVKSPKWRQSIKDEIKKVTSKWANDDFVHVVDTVDDLPVGLKRQIYTKGTERKVLGVYLDARVYIVADNAKSPTDAIRTLAHEAFGHLGIRSMVAVNSSNKDVFENRMNKILQEIHDSFSESDRYKHIVRKYNLDTSTAEGRNVAADEFLANVAEGDLTPTMWDKIVKFINDLMKSVGFDVNWTRADVLSFLQNAKKHVEGDQFAAIELDSSSIPENLFKIVHAFENEVFDRQRLDERLKQEGYKAVVEPVDGKVSQLISINERISKQLSIKLTDTAKENLSDAVPLFKVEDSQPEVRYRLGGGHNLSDYKFAYYRKYDEWVRRLHDRGIAGQRLIEGVTRDGGRVTDQSDFKQDDELKRGRVEIQLNRFENGLKKEYVQIMQQGNKGMGTTYEDYQDFIKARHAPDVNKRFEELTGEKNRSGLSKERIDEINAKIDNNGWRSHMESFGDVHDQIIDKNLKAQVAYGLITPGMYGKLKKMYPKYAPMRGFKDFEGVDPTMYVMPETQEGRSSEPGDVIGYTIALVESNIIRGETNLVKEKIFNFAADNPDFQKVMRIKNIYWRDTGKIDADTGKKRYIAELDKPTAEELLTGVVVRDIDPDQHLTEWSERDNPFTEGARNLFLMKRGKPAFIEFSDPHIAEWMKGHDMDIMPEAMNALGKYMRFLRNAYITYSPEFPLRNMVRDGTTGVLHIATDFDTKTAMAIGNPVRLARLVKPIWRALYKDEFGGDFGKNIKNFIHHGGMSGYYQLSPLKRLTKDLTEAIDQHGSNWYKVKKAGKAFHHIMQSYTSTVENLIRLSGYDYFMENKVLNPKTGQAFTPKQAARYFKSLTVNFDKKGSWAGTIGNIWIFYNATQKNVARLAEPFLEGGKRRRTRAAAVPLIMGSVSYAMADLLRIGLGVDEDDEFRFDKLNNFTVAHRIMIPNFASDDPDALISVPLPYGQNVYWAAGVYANKVANNVMTPQEMAFNLASISWQSFNPIGGEATDAGIVQSGTKSLLPTIFVPPFELATNVDFRGMPIIPEQRYGDRHIPQHKNYRYYTQQWAIDTAKALNRISGGDDYTEGLIEMSPNAIEFLVSNYLGGAGYFAISSMNAAQKVVDHLVGDNLLTEEDIMRFPVARVYFAKVPASGSRRRFYENLDALNEIEWKYDQMIADERFGEADRFAEDNANLFDLIPFKNSTRVSVTNHFSELNKLPTDLDNYDQISEEILDRIQRFYNEFNSEYNRAAGTSASQNPPSLTRILNPSLTNILE